MTARLLAGPAFGHQQVRVCAHMPACRERRPFLKQTERMVFGLRT